MSYPSERKEAILRKMLPPNNNVEETIVLAIEAIRVATRDAVTQVTQNAQAQAEWMEQVALRDRASLLEEQKALQEAWKTDVQALIETQNAALQQVVLHRASAHHIKSSGTLYSAYSSSTSGAPSSPVFNTTT